MRGLCLALWTAREEEELVRWPTQRLCRLLYEAIAVDLGVDPNHDPETDVRVHWVRELIAAHRRGERKRPRADAATEETLEMLLKKGEWERDEIR